MRYLARIIVALTFGLPLMAAAQSPPSEYQLKAAFLLNFARYAEWPSLPSGSLKVCLYGRDPFGAALSSLEHRQVQGREVKVVLLGSIEQASACQLLFISDSEERRSATLLRSLAGTPVLTVSDMEGFVDEGGGIG
ncbi:MAG: YfiR family protein, partial [Rhodocyclaceae bacterium]|nr:YfiR family protein [Rhodocyclaceae bacterium]